MIVFGGAFNPPTIAHLNIIKKLLSIYKGSQILLLPVGNDYSKPELIDIKHRMQMLKILTMNSKNTQVSDLEANRKYQGTLASLKELGTIDDDIRFVIGSDNLARIKKWIKYEELLTTYPLIIMNRKGSLSEEEVNSLFADVKHQFTFIDFDEDISSTEAREHPEKRSELLTDEVHQYILKNHLYKESIYV